MPANGTNAAVINVMMPIQNGGVVQVVKSGQDEAKKIAAKTAYSMEAIRNMASAASIGIFASTIELLKATQAAMMFEDAFAGIRKTVDASEEQFSQLADQIQRISTVTPVSAEDLSRIGELGGQLGVAVSNLPTFIKTVSDLSISTNLTVDNAALGLARLDAIAQAGGQTFSNMASTIVDLGNNFAATEGEIMTTVLRIAQAAAQVGAGTEDALAFATALQGIGVPAQAGGTAVARVFQGINQAVIQGGANLELFGKVAATTGKTTEESFKAFFQDDPARATQAFIEGLNKINDSGQDVISILDQLGLSQRRTMLAILGLAEAGDLLGRTIDTGRSAWEDNTAATNEAIKRYQTLASQIQVTKNAFNQLQVQIGNELLPQVKAINTFIQNFILGVVESEHAVRVLNYAIVAMTTVMGYAALQIERVRKLLMFFVGGPWKAAFTVIAVTLTKLAIETTVAAGAVAKLRNEMEAFSQSGLVTESTIRSVIKANTELKDLLDSLSFGDQLRVEQNIIDLLFGDMTPKEAKAEIDDAYNSIRALYGANDSLFDKLGSKKLLDFMVDQNSVDALEQTINAIRDLTGIRLTEEEAMPYLRALKDGTLKEFVKQQRTALGDQLQMAKVQKELYDKLYPAMAEQEERRLIALEQEAMTRLGIKKVEYDFQRTQIKQTMALIELERERADNQSDYMEEVVETANIFTAISDNVTKGVESMFDSLDGIGEMSKMSAEEINKNLAEKIRLKEIFEEQTDFLLTQGRDDVALFFSKLGPEYAGALQNLLNDPSQLNAMEIMLEGLDLSETTELKDALLDSTEGLAKEAKDATYELGKDWVQGFINGLDGMEDDLVTSVRKVMKGTLDAAYQAGGFGSPSRYTTEMGEYLMLGFVQGFVNEYPNAEMVFKDTTIDLIDVLRESIDEAVSSLQTAFSSQFSLFGAQRSQIKNEQKLNELIAERTKLLKGNTAEMQKNINDARDKRDFLKLAYEEGTISLEEYQIAEQELSAAENARQERLDQLNEQIEDAKYNAAQAQFNMAMQSFQLLQLGPDAINQFKDLAKALGIDGEIIETITGKTQELAQTMGTKFGGEVDKIAQKFFATNLAIEQDEITINFNENDTASYLSWLEGELKRITGQDYNINFNYPGGTGSGSGGGGGQSIYFGGGRIKGYANGGYLPRGMGLVGEYGPELIRAIPGGGVDITPLGASRGSNITIQNLNVNVTGVPSDPMQARKAAIEIRKALVKLDKEGLIGTGIRGR